MKELLGAFGEGSGIRPPLQCHPGYQTTVGARSFANRGLVLLDVATVTIGDDVQFGPHVQLLTPTHPVEPEPRRAKWEAAQPIVIGDNVWLGGGAVVLAGVTIGDNSVVGAGAVVTRDVPPRSFVQGVPGVIGPLPAALDRPNDRTLTIQPLDLWHPRGDAADQPDWPDDWPERWTG